MGFKSLKNAVRNGWVRLSDYNAMHKNSQAALHETYQALLGLKEVIKQQDWQKAIEVYDRGCYEYEVTIGMQQRLEERLIPCFAKQDPRTGNWTGVSDEDVFYSSTAIVT